jgi:hypothetical protein
MSVYYDPNNPLVDDAFVELRRRQRWLLAAIPDWAIPQLKPPWARVAAEFARPPRRILLEQRLRALADEAAGQLCQFLADGAKAAGVYLVPRFLLAQRGVNGTKLTRDEQSLADALDAMMSTKADEWSAAKVGELDPKQEPVLRRLIALLVWADELAGDYRDARLDEKV